MPKEQRQFEVADSVRQEGYVNQRERVYLPATEVPYNLSLEYPRTIINALIHEGDIPFMQALLLAQEFKELFSDHYDPEAVARGDNLLKRSVADLNYLFTDHQVPFEVATKRIKHKHPHPVANEVKDYLRQQKAVVVGDATKAVLVVGFEKKENAFEIVEPFPAMIAPQAYIDLSVLTHAITKLDAVACIVETKKTT